MAWVRRTLAQELPQIIGAAKKKTEKKKKKKEEKKRKGKRKGRRRHSLETLGLEVRRGKPGWRRDPGAQKLSSASSLRMHMLPLRFPPIL